jgi:protein tyrosine/serine phosphatase
MKISRRVRAFTFLFLVAPVLIALLSFSTPFSSSQTANSNSSGSASSFTAEKIAVPGVLNAGKVSEHLFRGAQPDLADLAELKKLGITTIVDLRAEFSGTREQERARVEALGMHFLSIPIGYFANPSSAQLAQFFSLLSQSPNEKVFVHCRYGRDRTGVFIAAYRIVFDHWTANQALAEMDAFGFSRSWHPGMLTFVRNFPDHLQNDTQLKPFFH